MNVNRKISTTTIPTIPPNDTKALHKHYRYRVDLKKVSAKQSIEKLCWFRITLTSSIMLVILRMFKKPNIEFIILASQIDMFYVMRCKANFLCRWYHLNASSCKSLGFYSIKNSLSSRTIILRHDVMDQSVIFSLLGHSPPFNMPMFSVTNEFWLIIYLTLGPPNSSKFQPLTIKDYVC